MGKLIKPLPLAIVYAIIIYFSLRIPPQDVLSFNNADKLGHFAAYLTLSLTVLVSINRRKYRITFILISFALGITLEVIQGVMAHREMSFADGVANTIGLAAGIIIYKIFKKQIIYILKKIRLNTIFLNGK